MASSRARQQRAIVDACRLAVEAHELDEAHREELVRVLPRRTADITLEVARLAALDARRSPSEPTWKAVHEKANGLAEHIAQQLDIDLDQIDRAAGVPSFAEAAAIAAAIRRGHGDHGVSTRAAAGHEGGADSVVLDLPPSA